MMFNFLRHGNYHHVPEAEDCKTLISDDSSLESKPCTQRVRSSLSPLLVMILLVISTILTCILGFCIGRRFPSNLDATCTKHVSKYSPITEDVDISYNFVQFNGSFYKENIYRQDAGPEVDAAWEALGVNYRTAILPESMGLKSGLTKDHARRNTKYGGGYLVLVEGLHHLHCLNLLRKALYYNYDYYHSLGEVEFSDPDWAQRLHVSHCLDIIRQRLMCSMDIGVFGSVWVQNATHLRPFVDFNTKHVCRNFDAIRGWAEERQIPEVAPKDFMEEPGEGVKILDGFP